MTQNDPPKLEPIQVGIGGGEAQEPIIVSQNLAGMQTATAQTVNQIVAASVAGTRIDVAPNYPAGSVTSVDTTRGPAAPAKPAAPKATAAPVAPAAGPTAAPAAAKKLQTPEGGTGKAKQRISAPLDLKATFAHLSEEEQEKIINGRWTRTTRKKDGSVQKEQLKLKQNGKGDLEFFDEKNKKVETENPKFRIIGKLKEEEAKVLADNQIVDLRENGKVVTLRVVSFQNGRLILEDLKSKNRREIHVADIKVYRQGTITGEKKLDAHFNSDKCTLVYEAQPAVIPPATAPAKPPAAALDTPPKTPPATPDGGATEDATKEKPGPDTAGVDAGEEASEEAGSSSEGAPGKPEDTTESSNVPEDETEEEATDGSEENIDKATPEGIKQQIKKLQEKLKEAKAALAKQEPGWRQRAWAGVKNGWNKLCGGVKGFFGARIDRPIGYGTGIGGTIGLLAGGPLGALGGGAIGAVGGRLISWLREKKTAETQEEGGPETEGDEASQPESKKDDRPFWKRWMGIGKKKEAEEDGGEEEAAPPVKKKTGAVPAAPRRETQLKKAIPAKAAAVPRKPKEASAEDSKAPKFAHLDLDKKEQRTVEELEGLKGMKRVACTVKGTTYFGTLKTPMLERGKNGKLYAIFVAQQKKDSSTGKSEEDDTTIRVPIKEPEASTEDAPDNDTHRKVPIASAKKIKQKTDADTGQGDNLFQFGGSAIAGKELREQQERYRAAEAAKRKKTAAEKATRDAAAKKKKDEENDFNERTLNGLATSQLRGVDLAAVQGQEELAKLATGENITDPQKRTEGELMKREGKRISIRVKDRIIYGNIPSPYLQEVTEKGQDKVYIENCVIREKDGTLRHPKNKVVLYVEPEATEPVEETLSPEQKMQQLREDLKERIAKLPKDGGEIEGARTLLTDLLKSHFRGQQPDLEAHTVKLIGDSINNHPGFTQELIAILRHPLVHNARWANQLRATAEDAETYRNTAE